MKKTLSFLFVLLMLTSMFLVSCGEQVISTTEHTETNIQKDISVENYFSSSQHPAVEMKSRVLLAGQIGQLYYYSKADGESYPFCFNPICPHTAQANCPSILFKFQYASDLQMFYNEYNNRVYVVRGQQIYSMSFDASDLRLECSLGEKGKIDDLYFFASRDISRLMAHENYLYFMYNNEETGHAQIYRYDVEKRVMKAMTSETNEWVRTFMIANGYIYVVSLEDELPKYYTTDYDFEEKHYFENPGTSLLYDGEYFYQIEDSEILMFNPITEEKKSIKINADVESVPRVLAVHEGYLYYQPQIKGGYSVGDQNIFKTRNIMRVSMDGEAEEVFDMPGTNISGMNFVSDGVIIFFMAMVMHDGNGTVLGSAPSFFAHYDLTEDGRFINPKPIGKHANNEELIEYLAKYGVLDGSDTVNEWRKNK